MFLSRNGEQWGRVNQKTLCLVDISGQTCVLPPTHALGAKSAIVIALLLLSSLLLGMKTTTTIRN